MPRVINFFGDGFALILSAEHFVVRDHSSHGKWDYTFSFKSLQNYGQEQYINCDNFFLKLLFFLLLSYGGYLFCFKLLHVTLSYAGRLCIMPSCLFML